MNLVRPGDERFGPGALLARRFRAALWANLWSRLRHFAIALDAMGDESLSVGTRARVHTGAWWAHACWTMGDFARAADLAAEATAYARASGHRYSLVVGRAFEAITHQLLDERSKCAEAASHVRAMCKRYQFTYYDKWGQILEGWARGGRVGVQLIEAGLSGLRAENAHVRMPYWLSLLAQTTERRGVRATDAADRPGRRPAHRANPGGFRTAPAGGGTPGWRRSPRRPCAGRELARAQHSPAMVTRCEADLGQRSLRWRHAALKPNA